MAAKKSKKDPPSQGDVNLVHILQEMNEIKGLLHSVILNQARFVTKIDDIPTAIEEKNGIQDEADEEMLAILPFQDMKMATDHLSLPKFRKALYRRFDNRAPRSSRFVPWFFTELFCVEIIAKYHWPTNKYV
jgi:hypothetical protein